MFSCHPPGAHIPLWWDRISGSFRIRPAEFMQAQIHQDLVVCRKGSVLICCVRGKWSPSYRHTIQSFLNSAKTFRKAIALQAWLPDVGRVRLPHKRVM